MDGQKTARMGTKYVQDNVGIFLDFLTPELYLIEIVYLAAQSAANSYLPYSQLRCLDLP